MITPWNLYNKLLHTSAYDFIKKVSLYDYNEPEGNKDNLKNLKTYLFEINSMFNELFEKIYELINEGKRFSSNNINLFHRLPGCKHGITQYIKNNIITQEAIDKKIDKNCCKDITCKKDFRECHNCYFIWTGDIERNKD